MRRTRVTTLLLSLVLSACSAALWAQEVGHGAIVVRDTENSGPAPLFADAESDSVQTQLVQGSYVAGYTTLGLIAHGFNLETN